MCPKKFDLSYIQKINLFEPNLATERGSYVHLLLENETKKKPTKFTFNAMLPHHQKECHQIFENVLESEFKRYFEVEAEAEVSFGVKLTKDGFVTCSYYDKGALFRGKIDHVIINRYYAELLDWKTGKVSAFPAPLQLVMYAIWCFLEYPEIKEIKTAFVYVEHLEEKEYIFKREHLPQLQKKVAEKLTEVERAKDYPKHETKLCEYCSYRKHGYCDPETSDEFQNKMGAMINPYTPKTKDVVIGLKDIGDMEVHSDKGGLYIKQDVYYFGHFVSDTLFRQDHDEIEYQDGEVQEITKERYYELKRQGWVEAFTEIQSRKRNE